MCASINLTLTLCLGNYSVIHKHLLLFTAVDKSKNCGMKQTAHCVFPKTGEESSLIVPIDWNK